jgi:NAD(P)-dependent dehydrogenase (short-subunit alcohol dehydrogenase family)
MKKLERRKAMNIEQKTVLITGANRGIGQALVDEALRRRAKRVYAGTRRPLQHLDQRVTPLALDVTNVSQIGQAVDQVDALDVLINNAGIALYDDLSHFEVIEKHLAVNLLGLLRVTHAFLPLLKRSRGSIVNNLSLAGLAAFSMGWKEAKRRFFQTRHPCRSPMPGAPASPKRSSTSSQLLSNRAQREVATRAARTHGAC